MSDKIDKILADIEVIKDQVISISNRVTKNEVAIAAHDKNGALILQELGHIKELFAAHLKTFQRHMEDDKKAQDQALQNDKEQDAKLNKMFGAFLVIQLTILPVILFLFKKFL